MKTITRIAALSLLAAGLTLSGCAGTAGISAGLTGVSLSAGINAIDTIVANNLPAACAQAATADAAFKALVTTGRIPSAAAARESAAMVGVASICASPASFNAVTAIPIIANAYNLAVASLPSK